jgi:Ca-activated chloride channel homolog
MLRDWRWLLAALPVLGGAWALAAWAAARRERVARALGRVETVRRCAEDASRARALRARLRLGALLCLLLALAGPRWGVELMETRSDARQVVVAVDVSLSMQAQDVKPSRLERAKGALSLLLDQLKGERVGVVAFAGEAQIVCPVTSDVEAAKQLLGALEPGAVAVPGTAVGSALRLGASMLGRYPGAKALVLITDGEDHGTDPLGAAAEAARAGVRVFAVGVGTPEGEPIPTGAPGEYKKDGKGATVITRLAEETLSKAAESAGGAYYRSTPGEEEIGDIVARIKGEEGAAGLTGTANRWKDRASWPLSLAFLLLLAELLVPLAPGRLPKASGSGASSPYGSVAAALALLALLAGPAGAATAEGELRAGNRLYEKERYAEALERYGRSARRRPKDARPLFNAGAALYRSERWDDASQAWASVAGRKDAKRAVRADALYNLGGARYQARDYAGAAEAYRAALALEPGDADARHNLAVALKHLKDPPPPQQDKKGGGKDDPDKPKPESGPQSQPSDPRKRDQLTREEAEQVMRAVAEREKAAQKNAPPLPQGGGKDRQKGREDW